MQTEDAIEEGRHLFISEAAESNERVCLVILGSLPVRVFVGRSHDGRVMGVYAR